MLLTKSKTILKTLAMIALIFSLYSLTVTLSGIESDTAAYSILNTGENGLSKVNTLLEERLGLETKILTSSLKSLSRLNKSALLVIMSPTMPYGVEEAINLIQFILSGGSVLIVDDFGRSNTLLRSAWDIITLGTSLIGGVDVPIKGIYFNKSAILADAANYYKNPLNPIITSFSDPYGLTQGVSKVLTLAPTAITLEVEIDGKRTFIPMPFGFLQTSPYSWLETNVSAALEGEMTPDPWEWGGIPFSLGLALEFGLSKIALIGDPDIFSNKALNIADREGYDNLRLIENLFRWLTSDNIDLVIFDETHTSHLPTDAIYGLSLWLKILSEASSSWYVAPILPIMLFSIIFGYVPREEKRGAALLSRVERVTEESPFRRRIRWYKRSRDYRNSITIVVKNLTAEIRKKYGVTGDKMEDIFRQITIIQPQLAKNHELFEKFARIVEEIIQGEKKIKKEKQFIEIMEDYMEIKKILGI